MIDNPNEPLVNKRLRDLIAKRRLLMGKCADLLTLFRSDVQQAREKAEKAPKIHHSEESESG